MKQQKSLVMLLVLLIASVGTAFAHGYYRGGVGFYAGPLWGPAFYPPPIYYSQPQVIVVPAAPPPVYIEQREAPLEAAPVPVAQSYWYYCAATKSYYPYVKTCPAGWQKILPQPAQ